jgi:hypothetical protein
VSSRAIASDTATDTRHTLIEDIGTWLGVRDWVSGEDYVENSASTRTTISAPHENIS